MKRSKRWSERSGKKGNRGGRGEQGGGNGEADTRARGQAKGAQEEYQAERIDLFNGKHDLAEADGRDLFARALLVEQEHRLRGGRR